MATDHNENTPLEKLGYATDDVSPKGVAIGAAVILGSVAAASLVIFAFLAFPGVVPESARPTTPFQRQHPPLGEPVLQNNITNTTDIRDLRQKEDAMLSSYGMADAKSPAGPTYRIPIDDAIDLVAKDHSLDPTENWLKQSSAEVPGDLSQTQAGPAADKKAAGDLVNPPPKSGAKL